MSGQFRGPGKPLSSQEWNEDTATRKHLQDPLITDLAKGTTESYASEGSGKQVSAGRAGEQISISCID